MKKLHKVLIPSLLALSMGLTFIGVSHELKEPAVQAKAETHTRDSYTDLFKRVTDPNDIAVNDKVILACSSERMVYRNCDGNPAYLSGTRDKCYFSDDTEYLFLNDAYIVELTVYAGSEAGSFAFRGWVGFWGWTYTYNAYLGFDMRGRNSSYPGRPPFESVGYFYDGTGVRDSIEALSSWQLTSYDDSSSDPVDHHMNIKNVGENRNLGFTYAYAAHFAIDGPYNINLYKRVNVDNVSIETPPTKTAYNQGEELDLSGLKVRVTADGVARDYLYDNNRDFFIHDTYVHGTGSTTNTIYFINYAFNINLTIAPTGWAHRKLTTERNDYRGTYIVAAIEDEYDDEYYNHHIVGTALNGEDANTSCEIVNGVITFNNNPDEKKESCTFELARKGAHYVLKYGNKYFRALNTMTTDIDQAAQVDIVFANGGAKVQLNGSDFTQGGEPYLLYKADYDDEHNSYYTDISYFLTEWRRYTSQCIDDGHSTFISTFSWSNLSYIFKNEIHVDAQGYFANMTYTHGAEDKDSDKDLVNRYDYIVAKYSSTVPGMNEFMDRKYAGTFQDNVLHSGSGIGFKTNDNYVAVVVTSIVMVSISIAAAVMVLAKKKREQ